MPCESISSVFANRHANNNNNGSSSSGAGGGNGAAGGGKSRSNSSSCRKKLLRRRSAGGCGGSGTAADILAPIFGGDPVDDGLADVDGGPEGVSGAGGSFFVGGDRECLDEELVAGGGGRDATGLLATSTGLARFRLKRGSEATLSRSGLSQRNEMEAMLSRRRGSLPVEMLSISCSGEFNISYTEL